MAAGYDMHVCHGTSGRTIDRSLPDGPVASPGAVTVGEYLTIAVEIAREGISPFNVPVFVICSGL